MKAGLDALLRPWPSRAWQVAAFPSGAWERGKPTTEFDPIPAGKYLAVITDSEVKPTKSGTGSYLQLTFEIIEGEYKGRHLWARLNLDNPNQTAVKIARAELSAICRAVGVMAPKDSVELHNLPLVVNVCCKKRKDTDEIVNEIKGYAKKEAAAGQPKRRLPPHRVAALANVSRNRAATIDCPLNSALFAAPVHGFVICPESFSIALAAAPTTSIAINVRR